MKGLGEFQSVGQIGFVILKVRLFL